MKDPHTNVPWLCSVLHEPTYCAEDWQECTYARCFTASPTPAPSSPTMHANVTCRRACTAYHSCVWHVWPCSSRSTKCCKTPSFTCYEKNGMYARCMKTCPDPASPDPFTCAIHDKAQLESVALTPADPLRDTCSPNRGECTVAGCCTTPGFTCYEKAEHYAECLRTGECESTWGADASCTARAPPKGVGCAGAGGDCSASNCCTDPAYKCFQKDPVSHIARCMRGCSPDSPELEGWQCNVLGRSPPPAPPSPPPQPVFRATYGTTCATFKSRTSIHTNACSIITDDQRCNAAFHESTRQVATVAGAHVLAPCVWFLGACATGGPIECTPAQVTFTPTALPHNTHDPNTLKAARDAAKAQGAGGGSLLDAASHQLAGLAPGEQPVPSGGRKQPAMGANAAMPTSSAPSGGGGGMLLLLAIVAVVGAGVVVYCTRQAAAKKQKATRTAELVRRPAQEEDEEGSLPTVEKKKKKKVKALAGQTDQDHLDMEL